jgi:aspartate carbamoyltransferase catalytic subunit
LKKRLSADVISFSAQSSVKKETIDTVNNILSFYESRYGRVHAIPGAAYFLSKRAEQ